MTNKTPMVKEEILDIYMEKPNFGNLPNKTHEGDITNTVCDDQIHLELEIKDNKIVDASYTGRGCVIAVAGASLLTEALKGMDIKKAKQLTKKDMDELFGMNIIPTKVKCELLTLDLLHKMIK